MKVKELIAELQKQDPEKEVMIQLMIQQGDELTFADNHNPCTSPDPDDMCDHCNCWKSTRSNCS